MSDFLRWLVLSDACNRGRLTYGMTSKTHEASEDYHSFSPFTLVLELLTGSLCIQVKTIIVRPRVGAYAAL